MTLNIDDVLESIGEFGPYQRRIYFLLCLPIIFVGALNLSYVFVAAEPLYRCFIKGCDNVTNPEYEEDFLKYTTPFDNKTHEYDYCYHYIKRNNSEDSCTDQDFLNIKQNCEDGIVFDKSVYENTIVMEFNLTCQDSYEASAAQAIFFIGVLCGAFFFGILSDLIGRRKTILMCVIGMAASGVSVALVPTLTSFNALRFLNAFCSAGVFQTSFILGLEFVGPSKRVMFGIVGEYFFALGEMMLGIIAWAIPKWRMLQLVISAPATCFIFYFWIIPESIRWLQAKGKHSKVVSSLENIAKVNKKNIPLHLLRHQGDDEFTLPGDVFLSSQNRVTILHILKSPRMMIRTLFMIVIWIVTTLVYYGLTYNSVSINVGTKSSAPYIDFVLGAIVEIPGYTLAWLGMVYWGRKGSLILSLIISGASCIASGFLDGQNWAYVLAAFLLGKCAITCSFAIIYVFTAELFPTSVRNTILGVCSMFARIGGIVAPFSMDLRNIYQALPMLIFGGLATVGGLCTIIMPETLNTSLPDTINEAIYLGRNLSVVPPTGRHPSQEERESLIENQSEGEDDPDFDPTS